MTEVLGETNGMPRLALVWLARLGNAALSCCAGAVEYCKYIE